MSKPRNRGPKVVPMGDPPPATNPIAESTPTNPPPPPPKKKTESFYDNVRKIPAEDWGKRAFIYGYCIEPVCNLKSSGENKYLFKSSAPILDEDGIMIDYGSGKYRLNLVYRKPAGDKGDEVDSFEFEIYNPKYPPKIPRAVWMNDPRNERWKALLPKEEPIQPQTGLGTLTDAFKTFGEIRRDLKEEMSPPASAAAPATATDPMGNALQMVQTIMAMKADNPMVEIMKLQLQSVNDQAEKARDREAGLQREMREMLVKLSDHKTHGEPEKKFGLKEAVAELKDILPTVKDLLPQVTEAARAGRTNWLDVAQTVAPGVIDWAGRIALAFASRLPPQQQNGNGQPPQQQIAGPQQNGNVHPPAAGAPPQQQVPKFVQFLSQPFVFDGFRRYFDGYKNGTGQTGGDFAQWVFDGGGAEPLKDARGMGSLNIMALLKQSPVWMLFQSDEAKLVEFIDQALAWAPPSEVEPDDDDDDEVVDLTAKGV